MTRLYTRREFAAATAAAAAGATMSRFAFASGEAALPDVFFKPEVTASSLIELYERLTGGAWSGRVGIKIHGGEARVNLPLFEALQSHIPGSNFVEVNWASGFGGDRGSTPTHIEAIRRQGVKAPIDILDRSSSGRDVVKVPVRGGAELSDIEVPSAMLREYRGIVNLTNFKIPSFAGYTGAVKDVGIGLASPDGKAAVHGPGYARVRGFFVRLADAAKGITEAMDEKLIHINIVSGIAAQGVPGCETPRGGDIGIFASRDIVALDQACVDAIWGLTPSEYDALDEQTRIDRGFLQLSSLEAIGAGSRAYRIVRL